MIKHLHTIELFIGCHIMNGNSHEIVVSIKPHNMYSVIQTIQVRTKKFHTFFSSNHDIFDTIIPQKDNNR